MADNTLFPVFDVPSEITENTYVKRSAGRAPLWDFEKGDFATDENGRLLYGTSHDSWVLWCMKTIRTQRWAHPAYSDNAGIEADEAFNQPDRAAVQSAFERTVTEALLADPIRRTVQVRNFSFSWHNDSLRMECEVVGIGGDTANLSMDFNR